MTTEANVATETPAAQPANYSQSNGQPRPSSAEDAHAAVMASLAAQAAPAPDAPPADAPVTHSQLMDALDGRTPENPPAADPQKVLPAPNPAPAPQKKRLTLAELAEYEIETNVDGKTDVAPLDKLIRDRQREFSANKRFAEAKRLAAEAEARMEAISAALDDPDRLVDELRRSGRDPAAIAKALYEREQALANMTPEQRRIAELEQRERQFIAAEQARQQEAYEAQTRQALEAYQRDFNAVLDAEQVRHPGLRKVVTALLAEAAAEANEMVRNGDRTKGLTKAEARVIIREHVGEYERPAPELTQEQIRARITAEDVAAWQAAQKAQKPQSAPQLARDPNDTLGTPRAPNGQFAGYRRGQPQRDRNGRLIMNPGDAFRDKF